MEQTRKTEMPPEHAAAIRAPLKSAFGEAGKDAPLPDHLARLMDALRDRAKAA